MNPEHDKLTAEALARIAAAVSAEAVEAERIAALGKQGWLSALMKTLGGMNPEERQAEAPRIQALRARVADAIEGKKAALEQADLKRRLAEERLDLTLPAPQSPSGSVHPVSQVMDELAEIFADMGFSVATGPRSRTIGTISPRSTWPRRIRRGRCTTPFISPTLMRMAARPQAAER